jgi:hypothetical protein
VKKTKKARERGQVFKEKRGQKKEKGTDLFSEPVMMRSDPDLVDPVGGKSRSENKSVPFSIRELPRHLNRPGFPVTSGLGGIRRGLRLIRAALPQSAGRTLPYAMGKPLQIQCRAVRCLSPCLLPLHRIESCTRSDGD